MRVLLDTTFARRGPSGVGVYIARISEALRAAGVDVVEAANRRRRPPAGGGLGSLRNLAADWEWTAVELPARARRARADLIHHPLPALAPVAGVPQVVTVQDVSFLRLPELFDPRFRRYAARVHRAAARRAHAVIAPTPSTAKDIGELWGITAERIVVAPYGPGQLEPGAAAGGAHARHFLYLGDNEPRKDVPTLLAAHREYRAAGGTVPLVLAGRGHAAHRGIEIVDSPSRDGVVALLREAVALVHPSRYEGFGLTALEGMSSGTPVIAARAPGVVDVCGEAVRWITTGDVPGLAAALAQVGGDPALRRDLAERGRRRAAEFSWTRAARAHIRAYTLAAG